MQAALWPICVIYRLYIILSTSPYMKIRDHGEGGGAHCNRGAGQHFLLFQELLPIFSLYDIYDVSRNFPTSSSSSNSHPKTIYRPSYYITTDTVTLDNSDITFLFFAYFTQHPVNSTNESFDYDSILLKFVPKMAKKTKNNIAKGQIQKPALINLNNPSVL